MGDLGTERHNASPRTWSLRSGGPGRLDPKKGLDSVSLNSLTKKSKPRPLDILSLAWRRDGNGWLLLAKRRRLGRVMPDRKHAGMWRSLKSGGRLSEPANLSWAKNAVLIAAERELDYEHRTIDPTKCPEKRGVFNPPSSPVRQNVVGGARPSSGREGAAP
jgi:hypothetical protein